MNEITQERVEIEAAAIYEMLPYQDCNKALIPAAKEIARRHLTQTAALQKKLTAVEKERDEANEALESKRGETVAGWMKAELSDYDMVLNHCAEIYMHFSRGRISKQNTLPREVIAIAEEIDSQDINDAVKAATEDLRAKLAEAEAAASVMREALEGLWVICRCNNGSGQLSFMQTEILAAGKALSPTAGKDLLEKVGRMEEAMKHSDAISTHLVTCPVCKSALFHGHNLCNEHLRLCVKAVPLFQQTLKEL